MRLAITLLLLPAAMTPADTDPRPLSEPLLRVTVEPGYTTHALALQIARYPLAVLHADGTLIASTHPGGTDPGFRIRTGLVPAPLLEQIAGALGHLLPTPEPREGPVLADTGAVHVTARLGGRTERRKLDHLDLSLHDLVRWPDLPPAERERASRHLAFARLVHLLAEEFANQPYVPDAAELLVTATEAPAVTPPPWPVRDLRLADLEQRARAKPGAPAPVMVRGEQALGELGRGVVSGTVYEESGKVYEVVWLPLW